MTTSIIVLTSNENGANSLSDINNNFATLASAVSSVTGSFSMASVIAGTVDGSNTSFAFNIPPTVMFVDNVPRQKVSSDTTVNWTGTTVVSILSGPPNNDLFAY